MVKVLLTRFTLSGHNTTDSTQNSTIRNSSCIKRERTRFSVQFCQLESLSNDDGEGNENGKKAIGLDWQNNNFTRASRFFVHFSAVVTRLKLETS